MGKKLMAGLIFLSIMVMAAAVSGCAGNDKPAIGEEKIMGKHIFDPSKFSMAKYEISYNYSGNMTHRPFLVFGHAGENDGDRLTSVEIISDGSSRSDAWLSKSRDRTNKVIVTDARKDLMNRGEISPGFNFTVMDSAWNALETEYKLLGRNDIEVGAGQYDDCYVYGAVKTLTYGGAETSVNVLYYLHPSCAVPVKYVVMGPEMSNTYELQSVYGPEDRDSAPERTVQTYFELLDAGDFESAGKFLVKEESRGNFKPISADDQQLLKDNMGRTYGASGEKMTVQFVFTDSMTPIAFNGQEYAQVHWFSTQYETNPVKVYNIEGTFDLAKVGGNWRIKV